MASRNLISVFKKFPKELFRVNNGFRVRVRAQSPGRQVYDILAPGGMVEPKALDPSTYQAPNGASMRPNSQYQQSLVAWRYKGDDVIVYAVPEGTSLPEDLILVHERQDHYSLQPAKTMNLDEKITEFLLRRSKAMTAAQWRKAYPNATDWSGRFTK